MSGTDPFAAFYRESRERLQVQVYAYCGDSEVSRRALADGYASAAEHWRTARRDPEPWVRRRAFRAVARRRNRSREPWYQRAQRVPDEDRPLLAALAGLSTADRHLLIAHELAGLDPAEAGREAGVRAEDVDESLARSLAALQRAGVEPENASSVLAALGTDQPVAHVDEASRLAARGNRRRRESWLLAAGVAVLVAAVTAGSINAARRPDTSAGTQVVSPPANPAPSSTAPAPSPSPSRAPAPRVRRSDLARVPQVTRLDASAAWTLDSTSADFGLTRPVDDCLDGAPTAATATHYWRRAFSARRIGVTVDQALQVARTGRGARAAYSDQLTQFETCVAGSQRVVSAKRVRGIGDAAALVTLQYATTGAVRTKRVAIGRTGSVVTTWVVDEPHLLPVRSASLVRLLASSVEKVCRHAGGTCAARPYRTVPTTPAPDPVAPGFLSTVDLPLFDGLSASWVATRPAAAADNPSATECDRADFTGAGAGSVTARSYVIPGARQLPDTFGMTETLGTFSSAKKADTFVGAVAAAVAGCSDRQLTLSVSDTAAVTSGPGGGYVWHIGLQTSASTTLEFRVALVRVGSRVAEVTFTPGGGYDVDSAGFATLATRATQRLGQL
jgi:DNA-directed RNA polymerase specialized sigma24 family protein